MARSLKILGALLALALVGLPAHAQQYNRFGPANGILKGVTSSPQTSAAVAADVSALWSGTCNAASFLRGDGTCAAPAAGTPGGSTTQVQYNNAGAFAGSAGFTWTDSTHTLLLGITGGSTANNGKIQSPDGKALAIGNSTNSTTATGGTSSITGQSNTFLNGVGGGGLVSGGAGLNGGNGGDVGVTGGSSSAANGGAVNILGGGAPAGSGGPINITGGLNSATLPATISLNATYPGALVIKGTSGEWDLGATADPGTNGWVLASQGVGAAPHWVSVGGGSVANPTGLVGLTAVNGSATSAIRSDGSPALDQTISPNMTGTWSFKNAGQQSVLVQTTSSSQLAQLEVTGSTSAAAMGLCTSQTAALCTAGSAANDTNLFATGVLHLSNLAGTDYATLGGTSSIDLAPVTGSFTATMGGCTTAATATMDYFKVGPIVTLVADTSGFVCTSNATTFKISGLPTNIRPARIQEVPTCFFQDNSVTQLCGNASVGLSAGDAIDFSLLAVAGAHLTTNTSNWTASGAKGLGNTWTLTYQLR